MWIPGSLSNTQPQCENLELNLSSEGSQWRWPHFKADVYVAFAVSLADFSFLKCLKCT